MLAKDVKRGEMIRKVFDLGEVKDMSYTDDDGEKIQKLSFTITSNRRDRDRDVVNPAGAIIDDYANNPVMLWAHQYTDFPIARSVEMSRLMAPKADGSESHLINAIVEFQPDSNYHESYAGIRGSMVYKMYKTKFLNAVSIGFDPYEWEPIEEKREGKTPSELLDLIGTGGTHFTKWDMLEFSAVPVPSNPDALVDRKMRKEMTKELRTWATNTLVECERCSSKANEEAEITKPLPSEHACRLRSPDDFDPNSFRRTERDHEGKKYGIITGKLKGETAMTEQAYRYSKDAWDAASAKAHCDSHDGASFTAAKAEDGGINSMIEEIKTIEKAGAVLSGPNKTKLKQASDNILSVLASAESNAPEPAAPAAPAAPAKPNAPAAASTEPVITASYPLGHEAPQMYTLDEAREIIKAEKADDVIPVVDDGEKPDPQEIVSVDLEVLAEVTGIDVETLLESLNAQGEGNKTTEE